MSDNTNINNNNQVFQNIHMAERQPSTNTTNNSKLSIDNNKPFIINNITIPQNQQFINMPMFQQPLISLPAPPPPAAFQIQPFIQPFIQPNVQQKLNPSAPTFTPNPFSNIPVQGYNNNNNATPQIALIQQQIQQSLAKLQILSIQLNTLQLINAQNPTIDTLNQYQNIYQQYNNEFTNTLVLNQYINNLNNNSNNIKTITPTTPIPPSNNTKQKLETIAEGENESEIEEINNSIEGTKTSNGESSNYSLDTNTLNNTTTTTAAAANGELDIIDNKKSELEKIKKQIRVILNKITGENVDKASLEIASILSVSDIA
eukprot:51684_1